MYTILSGIWRLWTLFCAAVVWAMCGYVTYLILKFVFEVVSCIVIGENLKFLLITVGAIVSLAVVVACGSIGMDWAADKINERKNRKNQE